MIITSKKAPPLEPAKERHIYLLIGSAPFEVIAFRNKSKLFDYLKAIGGTVFIHGKRHLLTLNNYHQFFKQMNGAPLVNITFIQSEKKAPKNYKIIKTVAI